LSKKQRRTGGPNILMSENGKGEALSFLLIVVDDCSIISIRLNYCPSLQTFVSNGCIVLPSKCQVHWFWFLYCTTGIFLKFNIYQDPDPHTYILEKFKQVKICSAHSFYPHQYLYNYNRKWPPIKTKPFPECGRHRDIIL